MRTWLTSLCFLSVLSSTAFADEVLTLKDCYQLALKRSETIAISEQSLKVAEGQFWQSLSGVLPKINYEVDHGWQDPGDDGPRGSRYRRFTFSQPLFSGFKEYAAIAGARAQHREDEKLLERAKQLLFMDAADAFYNLQSYQQELEVLENIHQALKERLDELKRRQGLGRSRESEVASAEVSFYKIEAEQENVRSQMDVARQLLEFLTGQPVQAIKDEDLPYASVSGMDQFINKADYRADVLAAREALRVAQKAVTVARAGFWPSITLKGNSYQLRTGSSSDVDWDITLNATIPLFNGTSTIGSLKEALAKQKQAEWTLIQVKRSAILDIQNSFTQFSSSLKKESAFEKAAQAAQRNYQLQQEEYSHSLVSNLDVLSALEDMENMRRDYVVVQNETKRFFWGLRIATGELGNDAI